MPQKLIQLFDKRDKVGSLVEAGNGLQTNDNSMFLRQWHEVTKETLGFGIHTKEKAMATEKKWFPYNKGGEFRKWFGNQEYVINWENNGFSIKNRKKNDLVAGKITAKNSKCWNEKFYFLKSVNWSDVTSGKNYFRYQTFRYSTLLPLLPSQTPKSLNIIFCRCLIVNYLASILKF